jgi:hypothetical protein
VPLLRNGETFAMNRHLSQLKGSIVGKKIKRELECLLSPEEQAVLGIKACEERDKARLLKEEASALEKSAKEKERQVAEKKVRREVEVFEVKDFDRNELRIERADERKYWPKDSPIVEVRALTGDERQTIIDMGDDESAPKAKTKAPVKRAARAAK